MAVDPCPNCGAAMAADQRYCLACGERRAEARLDFLEVLHGPDRVVPAGAPLAAAAPVADRQRTNVAVIASIGCLMLAMGVGVLIGRGGHDSTAATPVAAPAQVIKVQGGGAATASAPAAKTPAAKKAGKHRASAKSSPVATAKSAADSKATNPSLKALDSTSGDDYAKQSQKLPNTVGTGGKAPPVDKSKPAGGGSGFEEIG